MIKFFKVNTIVLIETGLFIRKTYKKFKKE